MYLFPQQTTNVFASWWIVNIAHLFMLVQGLPIINVTLIATEIMEFTSL